MKDWCKENGNPVPVWEIRAGSVITIFSPSTFFATGKTELENDMVRPESLEDSVLNLPFKYSLSKAELAKNLGHKNISAGLKKVIFNLLKQKKIASTIPEKPNSRMQKYKIERP